MAHGHETHTTTDEKKSRTGLSSSFWFVLILVLLFIAAVNFVNVMGGEGEEGHGESKPTQPTMEATTRESLPGETGIGRPQEDTTQFHGNASSNEAH